MINQSELLTSMPDFGGFLPVEMNRQNSRVSFLAEKLAERIFDQPSGCLAAARALVRLESGIMDASKPDQPKGVLLFLGPTGTGKTETAIALHQVMLDIFPKANLIKVDATNYLHGHEISNILGAPPSYVGRGVKLVFDQESLAIPNVVLIDEVEKGHPDFRKLLLGILDDGVLFVNGTNGDERLSFGNSIIIMTSNIGADRMESVRKGTTQIGFAHKNSQENVQDVGERELEKFFRGMPEFKSRIHEIVVYDHLKCSVYPKIVQKAISGLDRALRVRKTPCSVITTENFVLWISQGESKEGARNLYNRVRNLLSLSLPDLLSSGQGIQILVDFDPTKNEVCYYTRPFTDEDKANLDQGIQAENERDFQTN